MPGPSEWVNIVNIGKTRARESWARCFIQSDEMTAIADELVDLAGLVRRLPPPNHRHPEAFHVTRGELARSIERIAARLRMAENGRGSRDSFARPRPGGSVHAYAGRRLRVQPRRGDFGL